MKKIEAFIRHEAFESIRKELLDAGEPVGIVNVGLRGEDAWIGGVGVAAGRRGSGIGETLMHAAHESARAAGATRSRGTVHSVGSETLPV